MRNANILKILTNASLTVGLGALTLFGGAARADSFTQRVQAGLNSGKDYSAAVATASRTSGTLYASELTPDARQAKSALSSGKDYSVAFVEAGRSAAPFSSSEIAKAEKVEQELNQGKDYTAALAAADRDQQPVVRAQAARERTRTVK